MIFLKLFFRLHRVSDSWNRQSCDANCAQVDSPKLLHTHSHPPRKHPRSVRGKIIRGSNWVPCLNNSEGITFWIRVVWGIKSHTLSWQRPSRQWLSLGGLVERLDSGKDEAVTFRYLCLKSDNLFLVIKSVNCQALGDERHIVNKFVSFWERHFFKISYLFFINFPVLDSSRIRA